MLAAGPFLLQLQLQKICVGMVGIAPPPPFVKLKANPPRN
jgi:hypothetical protein